MEAYRPRVPALLGRAVRELTETALFRTRGPPGDSTSRGGPFALRGAISSLSGQSVRGTYDEGSSTHRSPGEVRRRVRRSSSAVEVSRVHAEAPKRHVSEVPRVVVVSGRPDRSR